MFTLLSLLLLVVTARERQSTENVTVTTYLRGGQIFQPLEQMTISEKDTVFFKISNPQCTKCIYKIDGKITGHSVDENAKIPQDKMQVQQVFGKFDFNLSLHKYKSKKINNIYYILSSDAKAKVKKSDGHFTLIFPDIHENSGNSKIVMHMRDMTFKYFIR